MLFSKPQTIKERIVQSLQYGPLRITTLVERLNTDEIRVSKQGVYLALRELAREEVVVVYKKFASLNHAWLLKLGDFSAIAHQQYFEPTMAARNFKNLEINQRIRFTFKTLSLLDAFWGHVLYTFIENNTKHEPLLMYNPHWWFAYSRNPSELAIIDFCRRQNTLLLETIGHDTPIDRTAARLMDRTAAQYHVRTNRFLRKKTTTSMCLASLSLTSGSIKNYTIRSSSSIIPKRRSQRSGLTDLRLSIPLKGKASLLSREIQNARRA